MFIKCILAALAVGGTFAQTAVSATLSVAKVQFTNQHRFYFDVNGNAIDSVNGKVSWINNQYFWIAEPTACNAAVCDKISYSSPDLKTWSLNGPLFNISDPVNLAACSGFGACSRPKVIYNAKTQMYVFYGFAGRPGDPGISVFTSKSLTSGYTYAGRMIPQYSPFGYIVEDLGLAVIDGIGYVTWTGFNLIEVITNGTLGSIWPPFFQTVLVQQLTDDFLNGTGTSYPVIVEGGDFPVTQTSPNLLDGMVESPDLFKRGNFFYVVGSGTCSSCNGTLTIAYRSTSPFGPWTRQIVDNNNTCGGQAMGVMTVPPAGPGIGDASLNSTFVFQADEFHTAPPGMSYTAAKGHSFWNFGFAADGSISSIDCSAGATFSFTAPLGDPKIPTTGRATNATDGSGNNGNYWAESGLGPADLFQTWTSSATGNLAEVGVNLAANNPNQNLTITVFRFKNETQFLAPFFFWETLATVNVGLVIPVSETFAVQRIAVNAQVSKGDHLGIALQSGSAQGIPTALPYAYLLQQIDATTTNHVLYGIDRSHVSFEGLSGMQSPIHRLQNQEMKWYATVV